MTDKGKIWRQQNRIDDLKFQLSTKEAECSLIKAKIAAAERSLNIEKGSVKNVG